MTLVVYRSPRRRRGWRRAGLAAVIAIPLAFTGLVVAAVGDPAEGITRVPVALVNDDEMIIQTDEETGEESIILAGRLLVTELTASDSPAAFDWWLTNSDDAVNRLDAGEVYAVLTIPDDFSESILSMQGDDPRQARITIRTDDAHSYVAGPIAQALGDGLVRTFGSAITENFIVTAFDQLGGAFADAADGASQIADGAAQSADGAGGLADGIDQYTGGVAELANGLGEFTAGVDQYADGVGQYSAGVSQYASGMDEYAAGTREYADGIDLYASGLEQFAGSLSDPEQLPGLAAGLEEYLTGTSQLTTQIAAVTAALQADPTDPELLGMLAELVSMLENATAGGSEISGGLDTAIQGLQDGAAQLAGTARSLSDGAAQLADGAESLAEGAGGLADGGRELSSGGQSLAAGGGQAAAGAQQLAAGGSALSQGATALASGLGELATGTGELADGLAEGADSFSDGDATERMAAVAGAPVGYEVETDHAAEGASTAIATVLIPYAAWIGALVVFLISPRFPARSLLTSATSGRLLLDVLGRTAVITAAQAVGLVALLHLVVGASWALLPATLAFTLLLAVVFTAFHLALVAAVGRAGLIVSFLVLAVQFAASGVLLPVEFLAPFFGAISPFLPLGWATAGLQQILTAGSAAVIAGAVVPLILFGIGSLLLGRAVLARSRRRALVNRLAIV